MEDNKFTRMSTQDNFITEKVDIIKNNLLGDYDSNGNYIISSQIINELLTLKKHRKSSYGNSMFCVGNLLGYGEIVFELYFDKNTDNNSNAKAYLYVLEDVDKVNGYLQNTIKTKISEFSSTVENFIEESYQKFNVTDESDDDDEEGKEKKDLSDLQLDDSYILAKKAYMLILDKLEDEKLLDAYGKFFTAKITALSEMDNEFAKAVIEKFNAQYSQIEDLFLKEKNYKALNDLLDASIEQVSCTQDIFVDQENDYLQRISGALTTFTQSVNDLSNSSEQTAIQMLGEADRNKIAEMQDASNLAQNENDDIGNNEGGEMLPPEDIVSREENIAVANEILDNPILYEDSEEMEENTENEEVSEEQSIDEILQSVYEQNIQQEEVQSMEEPVVDESQVIDEVSKLSEQSTLETPVQADVQDSTQSEENTEEITILRDEDIFETDDEILANSIQKEAIIEEKSMQSEVIQEAESPQVEKVIQSEEVQTVETPIVEDVTQPQVLEEKPQYNANVHPQANIQPTEQVVQSPKVEIVEQKFVVPQQNTTAETIVPSQQNIANEPVVQQSPQSNVEQYNPASSSITDYIQRKQEEQNRQTTVEQPESTSKQSVSSIFNKLLNINKMQTEEANLNKNSNNVVNYSNLPSSEREETTSASFSIPETPVETSENQTQVQHENYNPSVIIDPMPTEEKTEEMGDLFVGNLTPSTPSYDSFDTTNELVSDGGSPVDEITLENQQLKSIAGNVDKGIYEGSFSTDDQTIKDDYFNWGKAQDDGRGM